FHDGELTCQLEVNRPGWPNAHVTMHVHHAPDHPAFELSDSPRWPGVGDAIPHHPRLRPHIAVAREDRAAQMQCTLMGGGHPRRYLPKLGNCEASNSGSG